MIYKADDALSCAEQQGRECQVCPRTVLLQKRKGVKSIPGGTQTSARQHQPADSPRYILPATLNQPQRCTIQETTRRQTVRDRVHVKIVK